MLLRRSRQVLLIAATAGAATGLAVAAVDRFTSDVLLAAVLDLPLPGGGAPEHRRLVGGARHTEQAV